MGSDKDTDILRPLSDGEVDELLDLYKAQFGVRNFHYLLLYNQRKWDRQLDEAGIPRDDPNYISLRKQFFTHRRGDFRQWGTYVSLHRDIVQSVSFFSWQPDGAPEMWECLEATELIEWTQGALLTNVDLGFCERIKQLVASRGVASIQPRQCFGMVLPHEAALGAEVPELSEFEIRRLRDEDAAVVHETWPNKGEGSLTYLRALVRFNKSLGVCRSDTGELLAWIFQNDFSGLGMLKVLPKAERRGLGGLLAAAMTRRIAQSEEVTLSAWIVATNFRSEALLKRIGYQKELVNEWIKLLPNPS
ncbi:uncharacterized protein LOC108100932 [Drosophila ficusphila]|uniref:uncharacterized protein LOC108100932 n=1 Tax=Drosophila ficusphila TaxID=30025 RepID=UPI0007E7BDCF|nr:uncharacterized protein LOC108100932 [Drosophila ficusphila]